MVVFVVVNGSFGDGGGSGVDFCGGFWWWLVMVMFFSLSYDGTRVFGWLLRFFVRSFG